MQVTKEDVIRLLEQISLYLELNGENPFKIRAFKKAASALEFEERSITEIDNFEDIPNIGKGTAAIIAEYISTGSSSLFISLQNELPNSLLELLKIPGLGPKKISRLYRELGITDIATLKAACEEKKVRSLNGFGPMTEMNLLKQLADYGKRPERFPLAYMNSWIEKLEYDLNLIESIETYSRAGSFRRFRETLKDLDYVIATNDPEDVRDKLLDMYEATEAVAKGETKVTITLPDKFHIQVDFRLVHPHQFATALHHFTGSKEHNVRMRQLAKERGEKISEYGIEQLETGKILTFTNEEQFYHHFNLPYIPPEIREDGSEVDLYTDTYGLIAEKDILGDLHMHTNWSDGNNTLVEMIDACRNKGYQYMAVTDHSQFLKVANGLSVDRVLKQIEEIWKLNEKYADIEILAGIEMDILPDGSLDFDDAILEQLDFVIASIHSSFNQPQDMIMKRLKKACENPHVDMIAHPTGRLIGKRNGYDVDVDQLFQLAIDTNTILELNADPNRLDLSAEFVRKAQAAGVTIAINTDAHRIQELEHIAFGIGTARKGWIKKQHVINTYSKDRLLSYLKN
ncbi:DNA polymerase/3'-5' exonuclease PolX [Heyndrickxia ginsengihumi]|uniref:DNA polymerase/3'-5' exonuclease PolX n=1 Tax=Heyndrickxia ginsengihumi TaxID=363870 RepID=A0A0A6Y3X5_9BACI|nr:DNA polymerase/3'-5' exonuclease PolX [Heyndrickxia ginsengihumi]KHD86952.1 hypothetical protein NG54_00845 [Heyndrickxia ginsengihumi]MBE6182717.1 DNA polymerase/3'-5' exonuclease PolX [Bacillus sp. (in: firmicutes)]MCM3021970.1 DNA polymerase/3'-5' exonuclease PolX [Heyndrickxia ginsengihumi]NEY20885.1 DNA polymerase/3'-5' exonuclease PolX [Heyndrickxia ginsengihumi]